MTESSAAPPPTPLTAKAGTDVATPIEPGTLDVEAAVTVTFAVG